MEESEDVICCLSERNDGGWRMENPSWVSFMDG